MIPVHVGGLGPVLPLPSPASISLFLSARTRHSQLAQAVPRLQCFRSVRIALDQMPQFADTVILLAPLNEGEALFQLCRCRFVSAGKVLQHLVIALRGLRIVSLAELNLA